MELVVTPLPLHPSSRTEPGGGPIRNPVWYSQEDGKPLYGSHNSIEATLEAT